MALGNSMFRPDRNQALWNCARECSLLRQKKKCKNHFGSYTCNSCNFYIMNYGIFNQQDAKLYMMQAESSAKNISDTGRGLMRLNIIIILTIATIIIFGKYSTWQYSQKYSNKTYASNTKPENSLSISASTHQNIERTLYKVAEQMKRGIDVDGDGLSNCIDAAVTFYKYFPDKSKVCIEVNRNPNGGMHHLFNCVLINGIWRAIEPQAYYKNHKSYYMRDIWGNKYDLQYNRDVTDEYKKYAK